MAGDPTARREVAALREAYEQHAARILRLCVLLTGRQETAEDLVQEAFVRVAPKLAQVEREQVGAYLRATVLNLWRNRLRRLAVEHRLHRIDDSRVEMAFEERDAMWSAIRRLPPRQRACLVLRFYEDLTERETAAVLGCSVGTVKSQTSRAVRRMRDELNRDG